ncbi:MAG: hypothetical protein DIZ80_06250 [endosymbiont of Galathealinum brachiosum]|uniref:DUF4412 domain-containing protein n=1 Tax=endosymbiont of Galathealinum brachiosum TaxID=2200906 RepID=A0A370DFP0_9GAMM|nr:MAG: hypothetical protein DIZ80_06250 [endosymbiont of Galathealinum brachiosum]
MIFKSLILSVVLTVLTVNSFASIADKEFSADAVVTIPGQPSTTSKLFVSKNVVRTEIQTRDGIIIDIVYPFEGKLVKLNTKHQQYIEMQIEKQNPDQITNPCNRIKTAKCTLLGKELIEGRETQKWQIVAVKQGKNVRTLHWVDAKRQLAIREFFNDGSMAEMKLETKETINGRNTERWVRTISRPDGSTVSSYQWYDPQLEISIKEELPGGYVRELKNIKVGIQKKTIFNVPDNYKMMRPEQLPSSGASQRPMHQTPANSSQQYR